MAILSKLALSRRLRLGATWRPSATLRTSAGACWNLRTSAGASWNLRTSAGTSWNLRIGAGALYLRPLDLPYHPLIIIPVRSFR